MLNGKIKVKLSLIAVGILFGLPTFAQVRTIQEERYTLQDAIPPPPKNVNTTATTVTATVEWNAVAGASSYLLEISSRSGEQLGIVQNIVTTSYTFGKKIIQPNHHYLVKVKSVNADDVGGTFSEVVTFRSRPARVQNLRIVDATSRTVVLEWSKPSGDITVYDIQVLRGANVVRILSITAEHDENGRQRVTIDNLQPHKKYAFTVRAGFNSKEKNKGKYSSRVYRDV